MTTREEHAARVRVVERLKELDFPSPHERRALAQVIEELESRLSITPSTPKPRLRWKRSEQDDGGFVERVEAEGHEAFVTCEPSNGLRRVSLKFIVRGERVMIDESDIYPADEAEERVRNAKIRLGLRLRRRMEDERS